MAIWLWVCQPVIIIIVKYGIHAKGYCNIMERSAAIDATGIIREAGKLVVPVCSVAVGMIVVHITCVKQVSIGQVSAASPSCQRVKATL